MSTSDPFTLGLGAPASSDRDSKRAEATASAANADHDHSSIERAERLADAVAKGAVPEPRRSDSEEHLATGSPSAQPVEEAAESAELQVPSGAVGGAGGRPFADFSAAQSKAEHLSAQTGDSWWVRAISSDRYVLVCGSAPPNAKTARRDHRHSDLDEETEDFRTKALDELTLSDFPDGHPVHRFGLGQYKRFAKRNFRFKPAYRSMWPLFLIAAIGGVSYVFPVAVITLLPDDAVHQLLAMFSDEALLGGVQKAGLVLIALGVGKALFQRHYRRYYLMPGFAKAEEGIIARKSTKISYANVVNYDVQQNPLARILNYGTLELSSAGSDGAEINMKNVFSPRVVELVLESRMEETRQALRR